METAVARPCLFNCTPKKDNPGRGETGGIGMELHELNLQDEKTVAAWTCCGDEYLTLDDAEPDALVLLARGTRFLREERP